MQPDWGMWLAPFMGGFIGWITNRVAIYLLFRPRRPVPVIRFQGLLPRHQRDLARSIGDVVQTQLMPVDALLKELDLPALKASMTEAVANHVHRRLAEQWPRFLPPALREAAEGFLTDVAVRETVLLFDRVAADAEQKLRTNLHVGRLAEEQIMALDLDELERLVRGLAHRQLRHIEWAGAVLGFLIGLLQVGFSRLMQGG